MYENQLWGNPYFPTNAQRFPTNQYQSAFQQPQFHQSINQIVGRPVDGVEMIQASDVPMNAPYALFPKRDAVTIDDLNNLTLVERIILQTIEIDMSMDKPYKEIYKDCKDRIEQFKDIAYLAA